ncbi:hypothetical protein [Lutimonas sp.]|uniref:hypothetical protein n=1 Tax=Lutimonas sp. TaxID=1872403 RepID=UPI003D9AC182
MNLPKYPLLKHFFVLPLLLLILTLSCDTNDSISDAETLNTIQSETDDILEIESIEENLDAMIESLSFDIDQVDLLKSNNSKLYISPHQIPECASVSANLQNNVLEIVLDFGDGCTTEFDNILTGKILISIVQGSEKNKKMIVQSFENFTFNERLIQGSVSKARYKKMGETPAYSLITKELKISWEDGSFSTIQSDRKREWIKGSDNIIWSDNVYLITGESSIKGRKGNTKKILITEALRREAFCKNIVSGKLEITKNDKASILDYGEGECDNLATLTIGDIETIIELKKRRRS